MKATSKRDITVSDGCSITCTCGHTADIDEFTRSPLGTELPGGSYQCPGCTRAWRIEKTPIRVHRFTYQGQPEVRLITEPNKIVTINSYL